MGPGFRLAFAGATEAVFMRAIAANFPLPATWLNARKNMHTNAEWSF
jgi:hypothetical protein